MGLSTVQTQARKHDYDRAPQVLPSARSFYTSHDDESMSGTMSRDNRYNSNDHRMTADTEDQAPRMTFEANSPAITPDEDIARNTDDSHQQPDAAPSQTPGKHQYFYRDSKAVRREIWQPHHGDGLRDGELRGSIHHKERFRFFQHDIGDFVRGVSWPPKYVLLDDKALWDIYNSKAIFKKERYRFWFHDFNSQGNVRLDRVNCGRHVLLPVADGGEFVNLKDKRGPREVAWVVGGDRSNTKHYLLTGERNQYRAVEFAAPAQPLPYGNEQTSLPQTLPEPRPESRSASQSDAAKSDVTAVSTLSGQSAHFRTESHLSSSRKRARTGAYHRSGGSPSSLDRYQEQPIICPGKGATSGRTSRASDITVPQTAELRTTTSACLERSDHQTSANARRGSFLPPASVASISTSRSVDTGHGRIDDLNAETGPSDRMNGGHIAASVNHSVHDINTDRYQTSYDQDPFRHANESRMPAGKPHHVLEYELQKANRDLTNRDSEIAYLKAENARLERRLEGDFFGSD